jgi:hypothetical protein
VKDIWTVRRRRFLNISSTRLEHRRNEGSPVLACWGVPVMWEVGTEGVDECKKEKRGLRTRKGGGHLTSSPWKPTICYNCATQLSVGSYASLLEELKPDKTSHHIYSRCTHH